MSFWVGLGILAVGLWIGGALNEQKWRDGAATRSPVRSGGRDYLVMQMMPHYRPGPARGRRITERGDWVP